MPTVAPCPPPTPLALSGGRSDSTPEVDPAATTVAMVAETGTRWGTAAVAACLAELAVTIVALYLAPYGDTLGRDADLLPELLDVGSLPMVVTPMGTAARVAAEVHHCMQADRAVRVSYALTGGADLQPVWPGRIGVVSR